MDDFVGFVPSTCLHAYYRAAKTINPRHARWYDLNYLSRFPTTHKCLPLMYDHMSLAGALVGEPLLAVVALVRLHPEVDPDVAGHVGLLDKLLGAVRAAVPGMRREVFCSLW
jgi:hypothetical protein